MAKNFSELLEPRMTSDGRIDLNWEVVPEGEWTDDLKEIIETPEDRELASLAVLAYRNLVARVAGQENAIVKIPGIGAGFEETIWYPEHDEDKRAGHIGRIAVLVAYFGVPDIYQKTEADQHLDDWLPQKTVDISQKED